MAAPQRSRPRGVRAVPDRITEEAIVLTIRARNRRFRGYSPSRLMLRFPARGARNDDGWDWACWVHRAATRAVPGEVRRIDREFPNIPPCSRSVNRGRGIPAVRGRLNRKQNEPLAQKQPRTLPARPLLILACVLRFSVLAVFGRNRHGVRIAERCRAILRGRPLTSFSLPSPAKGDTGAAPLKICGYRPGRHGFPGALDPDDAV